MDLLEKDDEIYFNVEISSDIIPNDVLKAKENNIGIGEQKKPVVSEIIGQPCMNVAKDPFGMVQLAKAISPVSDRISKKSFFKSNLNSKSPNSSTVFLKSTMNKNDTIPSNAIRNEQDSSPTPIPVRISSLADPTEFKAFIFEKLAETGCFGIALKGRIEHLHQTKFDSFLDENLPTDGRHVILDLDGLVSISSSGWGVLVAQLQRMKKNGGNIALCGMHGEVENCFNILELGTLFPVFPTIIDALKNSDFKDFHPSNHKKISGANAGNLNADNPALLTLDAKIKRIIVENPLLSVNEISQMLCSDLYGQVKINRGSLRAKLAGMKLGSKEERLRFFRSA